jgi:hypothetical protein
MAIQTTRAKGVRNLSKTTQKLVRKPVKWLESARR